MKRKAGLAAGIGADCTLCSRPSSKQQLGPQHNAGSRYKNATQSPGHTLRGLGPQQTPEQRARGSVSLPEPRLRGHLRPTRYGWVHVPDFFKRLRNSRQTQSKTEEPYFCGSQGPGSVPSSRDAMAHGLAGAYKHERCRGEGFSPFHACPAPAGAAGHARDTPLRIGGRIAKAQPIQNPVLRFALSPSVRQVQPNERCPGDTWSSLCFSTGQSRVTDPNLQSAAGAWVRPGLSGH